MGWTPWQRVEGFEFDHISYEKKEHKGLGGWVARIAFNRPENLMPLVPIL